MLERILRSQHRIVRPPLPADADYFCRDINDWDVIRMIALPKWPYPRKLADVFVSTASSSVIECDGEVVGAIGIGRRGQGYNLGFWLGNRYSYKGFMTEAATTLIDAFFADRPDDTLHSAYIANNTASWRVQQKLGFIEVGSCRLNINSPGGDQPGMQTVLSRSAFEGRCS